jgi:thioester reductase-like protein
MSLFTDLPAAPVALLEALIARSPAVPVADIVSYWGAQQPAQVAVRFLRQTGDPDEITFGVLADRIRACGASIAQQTSVGDRVLLLFQPGPDFVVAFLACQWAGTVPVPAMPLRAGDDGERLGVMVADCGIALAVVAEAAPMKALNLGMPVVEIGELAGPTDSAESARSLRQTDLAFLQYTSGSTGRPKGVMVGHNNLLANLKMIARRFGAKEGATCVSWLPAYHDMGLIGTLLMPLVAGLTTTLMSPTAFLRDPLSWLRAISKYRADVSGAPNFAFEFCAKRLAALDPGAESLDLSSWRLAFTGAEPVRARTLAAFAAAAAPYGFRPDALQPCYGLAECTLYAAAAMGHPTYLSKRFDLAALTQGKVVPSSGASKDAVELVLSGDLSWSGEGTVRIVNPTTNEPAPENQVGEIWISGPHVAQGYWRKPQETAEAFYNTLADDDQCYLRTRDLGFVHEGRLYVAGRRDDVMILNGLNYFPEDIEQTVSAADPALPMYRAAVFDAGQNGETAVVAVQEIARQGRGDLDVERIKAAIRSAVSARHGIGLKDVVLLRPFALPLTSSGKVRRRACRDSYLSKTLDVFTAPPPAAVPAAHATSTSRPDPAKPSHPIAALLAEVMRCPVDTINLSLPISGLGLDSLQVVQLQVLLESQLGWVVPTEMLLADQPINALRPEDSKRRSPATFWADASLSSDVLPHPGVPGKGHILVTGGTGVVGGQLIKDLLEHSTAQIYCLVRGESDAVAENRLYTHLNLGGVQSRLVVFAADMSRPRFGLTAERYDSIAADVGTVIHCAAELDFLKPYEALRPQNVEAVKELLSLGTRGRAKHYVYLSSISAIEAPARAGQTLTEDTTLDFPDSLAVGYAQSKWVGEKLMRSAADRGFAVDVLRPGWIIDGAEFLTRFIAACRFLGAVPDGGHGWNFVMLGTVIGAVRQSLREPSLPGKLRVQHLGSLRPVLSCRFAPILRRHGVRAKILPVTDWCNALLERATEAGNPLAPFTPLFRTGRAARAPAYAYMSGALPTMDSRRTLRWLAKAGVPVEAVDLEAVVAVALRVSKVS